MSITVGSALLGVWLAAPKNPYPLYFITQSRIKGSVRPPGISLFLCINYIPFHRGRRRTYYGRRSDGRGRETLPLPPPALPSSLAPTLGLISHGCSFNNPFLPPQSGVLQRRATGFASSAVGLQAAAADILAPSPVRWWLGATCQAALPLLPLYPPPSEAIKIAAISISFISGEGATERASEHLLLLLGHSGIFSARPTRTRNFPNTFDSLLLQEYWPSLAIEL